MDAYAAAFHLAEIHKVEPAIWSDRYETMLLVAVEDDGLCTYRADSQLHWRNKRAYWD